MVKLVFLNMDCCRDSAAANTMLSAPKPFDKKDARINNREKECFLAWINSVK